MAPTTDKKDKNGTTRPRDLEKLQKKSIKRRMNRSEKKDGVPQAKATSPAQQGGGGKKASKKRRRAAPKRKKRGCMARFFGRLCSGGRIPEVNRRSEGVCNGILLKPKELRRLKRMFDAADIDGAGNIDFDEFFESIGMPRTPFTEAVFLLIDDPTSLVKVLSPQEMLQIAEQTGAPSGRVRGLCNFDDFVQVVCSYCMYSKEDILMFAFAAFDKDSSGVIDEQEFVELCATVNNMNPTFPGNFNKAMEEFDKNDDGNIDFEEFKALNRRYPMVLFPAFQLQDAMQRKTLGPEGWRKVAERVQMERDIEEYQRTHNGRMPPTKMLHQVCCWLKPKRPRGIGGGVPTPNVPTARNIGKRLAMGAAASSSFYKKKGGGQAGPSQGQQGLQKGQGKKSIRKPKSKQRFH